MVNPDRFYLKSLKFFTVLLSAAFLTECQPNKELNLVQVNEDPHSFSQPSVSRVKHLDLNLKVDFEQKLLQGFADFTLDHSHGKELILDNMGLEIEKLEISDGGSYESGHFYLSNVDTILGSALHIELKPNTEHVRIYYHTGQEARALQWVPAEQTESKKQPFLFTQSQSIYARSWLPCPDGPGMRFSYRATITCPPGYMAVMSAQSPQLKSTDGVYQFEMEIPIPAYLMALAVGDFEFAPIGKRTGVYAPKTILEKCQWEFVDLEKMLEAAENLYGPYPWGRYDVMVLPPSFPFGGMENPRMTFLTPSVIVGDRSLTSLLAHELAHSWSGNLVTNASWNDFWLNEGFTTYFESRIMEALYGKEYADMLSLLGLQDLNKTLKEMDSDNPLSCLKLNLKGMDPEDALTDVAYEKGKTLLRFLEERKGREAFDRFLKSYFEHFKFKSNTTEGFEEFLNSHLLNDDPNLRDSVRVWLYKPGMPSFHPSYSDSKFKDVEKQMSVFLESKDPKSIKSENWSTHEWLHFLRKLPLEPNAEICSNLDTQFKLSESHNSEILCAWFEYAIQNRYASKIQANIEQFLLHVGRRKYLLPLYEAYINQGDIQEARRIYALARSSYHPIAVTSLDKLLK